MTNDNKAAKAEEEECNEAAGLLRDLAIEQQHVSALYPNPRNARTHSKRQVKAIVESIQAFGFTSPILIDDQSMILAGHGRVQAAKLLGLNTVPTIRISELSEAQKRALVLADNQLAARAGWDQELLAVELGELAVMLPDLGLSVELTGFEVGEIDAIMADAEEERAASREDEIVSEPETPVSRLGDLWTLGRHRVLCGDARDRMAVQILLGEESADLVFTDPPYNIRIDGNAVGKGQYRHSEFAMASGEMSEEEFIAFLRQVLDNAASSSKDGALSYVCMDWRHIGELLTAGKSVYSALVNLCVWTKTNGGLGGLYRSQHELVAVFGKGADYINNVELGRFGRNRSNVWQHAGVNGFKADRDKDLQAHPTVKPVALVADVIKDVTRRGAIVLDLFGGSGTTLIAAERTGRRARLLEIEPRYVDVTIRRFEQITQVEAIHAGTGKSFAELSAERIKQ